jgi:folate-binding protein YgfZ
MDIAHQYRIIASRAGWIDRSDRGFITLSGSDRLTFLHALVTSDVMAVAPGRGTHAAYLTPQGRMIADLDVLNRGNHVLVLTTRNQAAALAQRFDALVFAENVAIADVSDAWRELAVTGTAAAAVLGEILDCDAGIIEALGELDQLDVRGGVVCRGGASPFPFFRLLLPAAEAGQLAAQLATAGAVEIDPALATALRIEAGRPEWGHDLFEDTIPLEAGLLERAISTTKGCYVGQEVIIRILHRGGGRVARRLVRLALPAGVTDVPVAGTPLVARAEVTGKVTSAAFSPHSNRVVALGYVHRDMAEVGARVVVGSGPAEADVTGLAG